VLGAALMLYIVCYFMIAVVWDVLPCTL